MKKIVPDPPPSFPIPYVTIIADLILEDAKSHLISLMDNLSKTCDLFVSLEADDQRNTVLENIGILTELLHALSDHMRALEAGHG
ncbi:hypothetical protein F3J44_20025 [Pantoea sp. Tr-811]|uniref:hypothetical protein n=1 Tax=Pantoea sp. Tr-811 TaxID=2608361 RepID=UPI0014240954|nr:hypothetical protein [Pantoea sp. Tr-811]NIF28657.1 hypothetical protein [Pantoea sp. Tr-811]